MKNKKITSMFLIFLGLLFLSGALLLLTSILKQKEVEDQYSIIEDTAITSILENVKKDTEMIDENIDLEALEKDELAEVIKKGSFGILKVPAIDIKAPVTMGLSNNILKYYIGMYTSSDAPGTVGGNSAFAAHSVIPNTGNCQYCFFNHIDKLKNNDSIVLYWHNGYKYIYKVTNVYIKKIKESDIAYQKIEKDSLLTLVTCSEGNNDFRTFVVAKLIKTESF